MISLFSFIAVRARYIRAKARLLSSNALVTEQSASDYTDAACATLLKATCESLYVSLLGEITDGWCKAESIYEQIYPSLIAKERIEAAWCFFASIYEQIRSLLFSIAYSQKSSPFIF
ncbi:MAG: hypothetical protein CMG85_20415 [Marinobacter sp.]|nr:hypothetical protein [Marinobacter sp.]